MSSPDTPKNTLANFKPYIPPDQSPAEMTFRALVLGSVLGIVFGAASVYLGLRVGLTTSASIPCNVLFNGQNGSDARHQRNAGSRQAQHYASRP